VRLFVALEIPAAVRDNLATFITDMSDLSDRVEQKGVRWVRPENLHVTLKFIGERPDAELDGIRSALSTVHGDAPLEVRLRGLGFFPEERRPTVLWTGLDAAPNLPSLAGTIDDALATQGIKRENRAFLPHLTLARFAHPGVQKQLLAAIKQNSEHEFGSFRAREFHLIESKLKPSGAEYTSLASFPITLEA
jgi:RNA 2',3'-cyclic 3'-phosphodiesterase